MNKRDLKYQSKTMGQNPNDNPDKLINSIKNKIVENMDKAKKLKLSEKDQKIKSAFE